MSNPVEDNATKPESDNKPTTTDSIDAPTEETKGTTDAQFGFGVGSTTTPALDSLESQYGKYIDAKFVRAEVASFEAKAEAIRADDSLSETGRKAALAIAWTESNAKVEAARAELLVKVDKERALREGRAFGPASKEPQDRLAHRDAWDRVDRIESEAQAIEAVRRARISGDASMLRALTLRASDQRWDGALGAIETAAPGTQDALAAIRDLPSTGTVALTAFFKHNVPQEFGSPAGDMNRTELKKWLPRK